MGGRIVLQPAEGQRREQQPDGGRAPEDGRAMVVAGDIAAANGVIHAIDAVLVPREVRRGLHQD